MKPGQMDAVRKHGENLKVIFNLPASTDPVVLCKSLRRYENRASRLSVDYANGVIDGDKFEVESKKILKSVNKLLHNSSGRVKVFVNGDPRGYALKIEDDQMRSKGWNLEHDWGGYGLIAPEIRG